MDCTIQCPPVCTRDYQCVDQLLALKVSTILLSTKYRTKNICQSIDMSSLINQMTRIHKHHKLTECLFIDTVFLNSTGIHQTSQTKHHKLNITNLPMES